MDILSALFRQQKRRINLLVPSVVITEKHQDTLEITEHPVEVGAAVSDHAYKRPSEVIMDLGFSGGGSLLDFADTTSLGLSMGKSPQEVYQQLLDLQESRQPFDVITGKRTYKNMLIKSLEVTTDKTSENVLMCRLTLREMIISSTQVIHVADKADMKQGVSTSSVQNTGTKSTVPVKNSSLLSDIWKGATSWY
ncbi:MULTISPECIES: phage baseplate protein [Yersinia]|uniref:phage baseplate protein n=1 Tax=Yersinia TaxID=629 RepID=UPI0002D5CE7C|nr:MULTISPECIES: hypothetical protein [Yersinia]PEH52747.1 hypothetical protein CRM81_04925 [Yersinia kristensenii]CNK98224.1 Uncharacterised protein [Yersinia enterocolitica]SUP70602.1 Uncharacterised protein [Yersinia kristensenii]